MNRFDKQKLAIEKAIREEIDQYKSIYKKAEDEDRHPTDDERLDIESHLRAIDTLKEEKSEVEMNLKTLQHVDDIGRELGPAVSPVSVISEGHDRYASDLNGAFLKANPQMVDLGAQFVESAGYKSAVNAYRESGRLPSNFSTGAVALEAKGTLLEGAGGGGVGLVSVPQQVPGIVDKAFQPLTVADLLLSGQASTTSLRYVVEGTATSGAAGVAEGGAKPESALGFTTTDEPIKKIATILPVSEEMLEDAPAIQSYINGRLQLFVRIEEERQLVRGTSGGNEVQGLLTSRNVPVYAGGTAVGNRAEQLFKAMNGLRGSAFVEPEFIIMNPTDYEAMRTVFRSVRRAPGPRHGVVAGHRRDRHRLVEADARDRGHRRRDRDRRHPGRRAGLATWGPVRRGDEQPQHLFPVESRRHQVRGKTGTGRLQAERLR
jgi:HK97 family phage major capsid protein